jgi:hypothetical protein
MNRTIAALSLFILFSSVHAVASETSPACQGKTLYMNSYDSEEDGYADSKYFVGLTGAFKAMGTDLTRTLNMIQYSLRQGKAQPPAPRQPTVIASTAKELPCARALAQSMTQYFAANYGIQAEIKVELLSARLEPVRNSLSLEMSGNYLQKLQEAYAP